MPKVTRILLISAISIVFVIGLATPAGAATRVLTLSPSGSDSASGSADAPLRTLGAA